MAIYKNISVTASTSTTTLITKNRDKGDQGNISKILIANSDDTGNQEPTVDIYLDDGTNQYYIIRDVVIPIGTTLVLDNNVGFNAGVFDLKASTTIASGTAKLSIIIK